MRLAARAQLDVVEHFLAEFGRRTSVMRPVALLQAQHVAIVVTLRAVGNVLHEVDADTPAKAKWLADQWPAWQEDPIFKSFIKPTRDNLLKEFRGFLNTRDPAFGSPAVVADPAMPTGVAFHVDFDAESLKTTDGRPALPLFRESVTFWDRNLREAEGAFAGLR